MLESSLDQFLESVLFRCFGQKVHMTSYQFVGGGCINNTLKAETDFGPLFVKWNEGEENQMFQKEKMGLELLHSSGCVNVPTVLGLGRTSTRNFMILEYIPRGAPSPDFWEILGKNLSDLHKVSAKCYGFDHSNYIGSLVQNNEQQESWIDFFIEKRLEIQLGLAIYNGHISKDLAKRFRLLYPQLPGLLAEEPPSLLHGDLWSGNFMVGNQGVPYLLDPAVYFGNREIELSFTKLFGGFDDRFYSAYDRHFPLQPGFEDRVDIYNLYPLLVHVNLFGSAYLTGVERTIRKYV